MTKNAKPFTDSNANFECSGERPSSTCVQYFNKELKEVYKKLDDDLSEKPDKGMTTWIFVGCFGYTTFLASILFTMYFNLSSDKLDKSEYDEKTLTSIQIKIGKIETKLDNIIETLKKGGNEK